MAFLPMYQRLAELWTVMQRRQLTDNEKTEMDQCLKLNAKLCWDMAYLENISLMASITADVEWQHEICQEIESLQLGQDKKPGR
ncbi:hypothetical protein SAMN03159341_101616 [Paenibacillus sp. 1_12]|uniref:DUF7667 family protein n=1 Tax=Paenibacillus sp. 1_12 TaxID=1566278 RepID=UPI0008EB8184|nr:hypothetical protein [Paenibacillus sp. 1_12]SFK79746.1 hypothetical protein SAMN03159341_101616 [Paenibacillus sp. 1_12]